MVTVREGGVGAMAPRRSRLACNVAVDGRAGRGEDEVLVAGLHMSRGQGGVRLRLMC